MASLNIRVQVYVSAVKIIDSRIILTDVEDTSLIVIPRLVAIPAQNMSA